MKNLKATHNIWGNWCIYEGSRRIDTFGERWNCVDHVSDLLETGQYKLSAKSEITMADVEHHRAKIASFPIRLHTATTGNENGQ